MLDIFLKQSIRHITMIRQIFRSNSTILVDNQYPYIYMYTPKVDPILATLIQFAGSLMSSTINIFRQVELDDQREINYTMKRTDDIRIHKTGC